MTNPVSEHHPFVAKTREQACDISMIFPRFIEIGLSKYDVEHDNPRPAVQMIVRNALRLAVAHLGPKDTAALIVETLSERSLAEPVGH